MNEKEQQKVLFSKTFEGNTTFESISTITVNEVLTFHGINTIEITTMVHSNTGFRENSIILTRETVRKLVDVLKEYLESEG